jgi:Putative transmembrane protein (PGPGW)
MEWIAPILDWAKSHQAVLWWIFVTSIVVSLLTPIAVGWAIVQLPADYFSRKARPPLSTWEQHPVLRPLYLVAKNLLGFVLIIAGIAMLVLPGQGLLTIVVGVVLMNFPGKFRLERWLATRVPVWRSLNWLRRKARRPELQRPKEQLA